MERLKAYKFRIYPTEEQEIFFVKTFGCVRKVYNLMLDERIKAYEEIKKDSSKKMTFPTPAKYKEECPFLKEVGSLALANAQLKMKWYDNQLQKRSINFEPIAKMIYTINASFDSNWYGASKCDLEHVIPRKLIQKTANNVIISGGTLGNLMFLDSSTNRAKKEKFMYTYINNDAVEVNQEFIDLHFYPQKKNLIAVKIELESTGNDYSNTQAVIKNRGNDIITALVKQLG